METGTGTTTSCWLSSVHMPPCPPLERDAETDVCIVGAGISGLTTGYLLAREGKRVLIVDAGPIGGGETGRTTAHLANAMDDRFVQIEKIRGEKYSRLAAESHGAAIDKIEQIAREEGIDCDFRRLDGYLFEPPNGDPKNLQKEKAAAERAGLPVELVDHAPAPFDTGPALKFPRQGQFHPLKYLKGLLSSIQHQGGSVHSGTAVENVSGGDSPEVKTKSGHTIRASSVVVATNTPVNDWVVMHTKQAAYRTYAIALAIPRSAIAPILLWDNQTAYHYVRLQPGAPDSGEDLLIVGGEDHKTGQKSDHAMPFGRLEKWARDRYPMAGPVRFRWSGQVIESFDGLGFIGRNPGDSPNVYIITGDSGQGLTHGTIGGILITDLIHGRTNPWEELYDPSRKPVRTALEFAKENLNVAAQYTDFVTPGEIRSPEELRPGSGALMRNGKTKIAVYKDEHGAVHEMSAVCPHLQCIVHWNHVEKSWDCPCHGSRFDCRGHVLNGPAISNLNPLTVPN